VWFRRYINRRQSNPIDTVPNNNHGTDKARLRKSNPGNGLRARRQFLHLLMTLPRSTLLVPAAPAEPLSIGMFSLIMKRSSVAGWYSSTARDSQETMEFSALSYVHPMVEKYTLDNVSEA
jgi:hypothetical protein